MKTRGNLLGIAAVASFVVGTVETADAMVVVFPDTQPGAQLLNLAFFSGLDRLPGAGFDERAFSSFQYLISADAGDVFDRGDHFITNGEDRKVDPSIAADLGNQPDLSQRQFDFSIQHNFVGGRNFTFALSDTNSGDASTLC